MTEFPYASRFLVSTLIIDSNLGSAFTLVNSSKNGAYIVIDNNGPSNNINANKTRKTPNILAMVLLGFLCFCIEAISIFLARSSSFFLAFNSAFTFAISCLLSFQFLYFLAILLPNMKMNNAESKTTAPIARNIQYFAAKIVNS